MKLNQEEKENRNKYVLKLTELPFNTRSRDIQEIIDNVDAKTCFIPRSLQYKTKPFAIVSFNNEIAYNKALASNYQFRNKSLKWCRAMDKTCHKCGDPQHIAVRCPFNIKKNNFKANHDNSSNINNQETNKSYNTTPQKKPILNKGKSLDKLYFKYRPAQYRKYNRLMDDDQNTSYADVTRSKSRNRSRGRSTTRKNNNSNENIQDSNSSIKNKKKNVTISTNSIDDSIHNPNSFQNRMEIKMDLILNKLELMETRFNRLQTRITNLEKHLNPSDDKNISRNHNRPRSLSKNNKNNNRTRSLSRNNKNNRGDKQNQSSNDFNNNQSSNLDLKSSNKEDLIKEMKAIIDEQNHQIKDLLLECGSSTLRY